MKKIIFNGFYGYQNTGDDAFVEISSWGNQYYWHNQNPALFTGNPLPISLTPIKNVYPTNNTNRLIQKLSVFKESLSADYFINAGGSVFSKITPLSDIIFAEKAGILNKSLKHGSIGVSLGPFQSVEDEKKVIEYLKKSSFLSLRDSESFEYAKSLDLNYEPIRAFDLAALLSECFGDMEKITLEPLVKKKTIGVSVCNYERFHNGDLENENRRNQFVKDVLKLLSENPEIHFKFFIFNGNKKIGDEQLTKEIISQLPQQNISVIPYMNNVKSVWQEIKNCDFIISTRLHASVFACYANVPFVLIEYHRKCADFLMDIGYDENRRVYDAQKPAGEVTDGILSILAGNYRYPSNIQETIERARLNFTKIRL
ncbi:polysaccharide pyruvyl transferase family protein [Moheibacter lacus]|uniref:Polysaccharide pyruvyl transferase family protein n=1 Tax=Moheibacter lacus TaxID=2745851 RepID=A0A838ZSA3_9FLAO|nr:polysaccharide pyruvyl transferase family protein [Moheibacter lacus]MBA5629199.1 polysaccharide pyruvyl transferase family protein [Moheibacter lacus]